MWTLGIIIHLLMIAYMNNSDAEIEVYQSTGLKSFCTQEVLYLLTEEM
jgi:hypothetical protein